MRSDAEHATADQVGEALALLGRQEPVDFLEGASEGFAQPRGTLHTTFAGATGFGGVEGITLDGVGEFGCCSTIVNFGLSALGLQLVEDSHERRDLLFVEIKLVGQEAQRRLTPKADRPSNRSES